MRSFSGIFGVMGIAAMAVVASPASAVVINFDSVDTSGPDGTVVTGAAVTSYLASYGISFSTTFAVSAIIQDTPVWMGSISPPNVFGTQGLATAFSYTLEFSTLLSSLSFTRPSLSATIMSAWSATAYSASDVVLATVSEGLLFSPPSAVAFTLVGPGIAYVVFTDDAQSRAGTNFRLDKLTSPELVATPLPAALPLFAGGLGVILFLAKRRKQKASAAIVTG